MDLINFMGQSPDVPELQQHLASAGVTRQPQPEPGEDMAYVQFAEQGYEKLGDWDLVVSFDKSTNAMKLVQVTVPKR